MHGGLASTSLVVFFVINCSSDRNIFAAVVVDVWLFNEKCLSCGRADSNTDEGIPHLLDNN